MAGRSSHPPPLVVAHNSHSAVLPRHHVLTDDNRHRIPPHPSSAEDHIAAQLQEIQALLIDNQRLAATHVALKQDVDASHSELKLASAAAAKSRAGRGANFHELIDRAARADVEARALDAARVELARVCEDVKLLSAAKDELVEKLHGVKAKFFQTKADIVMANMLREEIEFMHREIQRGRAAVEHEKKVHSDNLEEKDIMEKNMISLSQEVEKLRTELAIAQKRAHAATTAANLGPGYQGALGTSYMEYRGRGCAETNRTNQDDAVVDSQYGTGAVSGVVTSSPYGLVAGPGSGSATSSQYGYGAVASVAANSKYPNTQYGSRTVTNVPDIEPFASAAADSQCNSVGAISGTAASSQYVSGGPFGSRYGSLGVSSASLSAQYTSGNIQHGQFGIQQANNQR